jgi:hypothetical protein
MIANILKLAHNANLYGSCDILSTGNDLRWLINGRLLLQVEGYGLRVRELPTTYYILPAYIFHAVNGLSDLEIIYFLKKCTGRSCCFDSLSPGIPRSCS